MRVLVACEYSGRVRDAFIAHGHDALSCDLLPSEAKGPHYQGDVLDILGDGWDLMVAHPPCTDLSSSGALYWQNKEVRQLEALRFVRALMDAPIPYICIENPVGIIATMIRPPDQVVQPYWFGDPISKRTCLWLKNLLPLVPTQRVEPEWVLNKQGETYIDRKGKRYSRWHYKTGRGNGHVRSLTPLGLAHAMAEQWSQPAVYCFAV